MYAWAYQLRERSMAMAMAMATIALSPGWEQRGDGVLGQSTGSAAIIAVYMRRLEALGQPLDSLGWGGR